MTGPYPPILSAPSPLPSPPSLQSTGKVCVGVCVLLSGKKRHHRPPAVGFVHLLRLPLRGKKRVCMPTQADKFYRS